MKYALFILIQNDIITADFTKLFFEHIECCFDFLKNIIMNRNSCIISDFWWEVCKIQMIKQCLFTTYHLQTNSQSEALNWIIENYLRAYTSENQTVWAKLLFLVQFIYNNSCNYIIQMNLNWLLHEFNCEIHIDVVNNIIKRRILIAKNCVEKFY